jgi:DNA-binding NarL/FixJ family response regulator
MSKKIKLLIAEDHDLFRETLVGCLKQTNRFTIKEVLNGLELLNELEQALPDVIVLDLQMPLMNGKEAFHKIRSDYPSVKIIICSQYDSQTLINDFKDRGADGYISKFGFKDLESIVEQITNVAKEKNVTEWKKPTTKEKFTSREKQIIPLLCEGKTNADIAKKLKIGIKAVEKHRYNLYKKTGSETFARLIKYFCKEGLDFLGE